MGQQVVSTAMLQCSFGMAPSTLNVIRPKTSAGAMPAANIMDNKPMVNIPPFAMCQSLANPMVTAATAAALGVLTPMPCIPAIAAPWAPGAPTVLIENMPALNNSSKCMCNWGGVISITNPTCTTVQVP
ncbi:MAG: DUF4280 domain-containing protein [Actinobacteria bacterium]|nr:DUF4280 domain-containing protein [Actinomycetota bacterium]NCG38062.1 DUF4280 domain-containing protein [Actinomycetota bacterium]